MPRTGKIVFVARRVKMSIYEFESFQLHSDRRLFLDAGKQVQLTSKAFNILLFFVQNPNRVISKDELLRSCWPTTTVLESNVTNHIFAIRQLLGEHPQEHRYIITVPGEGYRFVGEVRKLSAEADKNFEAPAARNASRDAVLIFRSRSAIPNFGKGAVARSLSRVRAGGCIDGAFEPPTANPGAIRERDSKRLLREKPAGGRSQTRC